MKEKNHSQQNGNIINGDNCDFSQLPEPAPNIATYTFTHNNVYENELKMEDLNKLGSEHEKKQMIGERLFSIIHQKEPTNAGRITSFLLTLDIQEAFSLIKNGNKLDSTIENAKKKIQERIEKEKQTAENVRQKVDEMKQKHETTASNLLSPSGGNDTNDEL